MAEKKNVVRMYCMREESVVKIIIIIVKPVKITMVTDKKECTNFFCSMISMGKVIKKDRSSCYK